MASEGHNSVAAAKLRSLVERVERLNEEISALNEDKSEVFKEARADGFDAKTLRQVVHRRAAGEAKTSEADALLKTYEEALHGLR